MPPSLEVVGRLPVSDGLDVAPNPLIFMSTLHSLPDDKAQRLAERSKSGGVLYASRLTDGYYGAEEAKRETLYLDSLDTIIDRLHELFDRWEKQGAFPPVVEVEMLYRARLVAHEWIAHLVQHADFEGRMPQIAFSVWVEEEKLCCLIADNSCGFKLEAYPSQAPDALYGVMPEHGMCWLLIEACTERRAYRPLGNQGFLLEFSIS